jgi:hypothetical protein
MKDFNCDRVSWDPSVGHHWMVVEYCDLGCTDVDCVDCGQEATIPLADTAEVMHAACNSPDVQVVFWMRIPKGCKGGKSRRN